MKMETCFIAGYPSKLKLTFAFKVKSTSSHQVSHRFFVAPMWYSKTPRTRRPLLDIESYDSLLANPIAGASWEGFVIENLLAGHERWKPFFLRTTNGAQIDVVLERAGARHLFECKLSRAPKPSRGFFELFTAMQPESAWVVAPVDATYEIKPGIFVCTPAALKIDWLPL